MCACTYVFLLWRSKCSGGIKRKRKKKWKYVTYAGVVFNINQENCLRVHQGSLMEGLIRTIHLLPDKSCEHGIAKSCEGGRICSHVVWSSWIFSKWSWKQKIFKKSYEIQQNPHKVKHSHDGRKKRTLQDLLPKERKTKFCEWSYGYIHALTHSTPTPLPQLLRTWKWYLLTRQLNLPWSNILRIREMFI